MDFARAFQNVCKDASVILTAQTMNTPHAVLSTTAPPKSYAMPGNLKETAVTLMKNAKVMCVQKIKLTTKDKTKAIK